MSSQSSTTASQSNRSNAERLIRRDGVLGFDRANNGFEGMTNFDIRVDGYVSDSGNIIGYVVSVILAVTDPLSSTSNNLKSFYLTNRELGNHQSIITVLTKFKALWVSQSSKETFLPQYVYSLCKEYVIASSNPKRFTPVKVIGKQPEDDIWVFNQKAHMLLDGSLIAEDERTYLFIEEDFSKLPQLAGITGEFDAGESLKELMLAERELFQNNFPQVIMTHAVSGIAANYDLVIKEFDGCAIPLLQGEPVSGKTTAMRAALSVFGMNRFNSECTPKFVETMQSLSSIPFGWDDVGNVKTFKNVAVNSFNAGGSSNIRNKYIPHTVPLVTTNEEFNDVKIKSRTFKIAFEKPDPQLRGVKLELAERQLKDAMANAHKSVPILTSYLNVHIKERADDDDYVDIVDRIERVAAQYEMDIRAQRMYALMLFCCKKILQVIDLDAIFEQVFSKVETLIIPSYMAMNEASNPTRTSSSQSQLSNKVTDVLKHILPDVALTEEKLEVLKFFENDFLPKGCLCGKTVAFHPRKFIEFCDSIGLETNGVTENAIRTYIKVNGLGCVGKKLKFRSADQQTTAAHISRSWYPNEVLQDLDKKLGTRSGEKATSSKVCSDTEEIQELQDSERDSTSSKACSKQDYATSSKVCSDTEEIQELQDSERDSTSSKVCSDTEEIQELQDSERDSTSSKVCSDTEEIQELQDSERDSTSSKACSNTEGDSEWDCVPKKKKRINNRQSDQLNDGLHPGILKGPRRCKAIRRF